MAGLVQLPTEMIVNIAEHIPGVALLRLCETSSELIYLCQDKEIWLKKLRQDFPFAVQTANIWDPRRTYIRYLDQHLPKFTNDYTWSEYEHQLWLFRSSQPPFEVIQTKLGDYIYQPTLYIGEISPDVPLVIERRPGDPSVRDLLDEGNYRIVSQEEAYNLADAARQRGYQELLGSIHVEPDDIPLLKQLGMISITV